MRYIRDKTPGATFFFTLVTRGRRPLFAEPANVEALRFVTRDVRARHPFTIEAAVVLPDHLHCLWTLPEGDADYAMRWKLIKAQFTRKIGAEQTPWQRRYWEHRIRDDDDLSRHLDYIHFNPVRHGLCSAPWDWPYSSFGKWVRRGMYPPSWVMADAPGIPHDEFD